MIVADASLVAAALVSDAPDSRWALSTLFSDDIVAPAHLHVEAAQMIRRWTLAGDVDPAAARLAHAELLGLDVTLYPYPGLGERAWELHPNVTAYDAAYVALAEALDVPLATLDARLARATGPTCEFLLP